MISIEDAKKIIHDNLPQPRIEKRSLNDASGLNLAEKLTAPEPVPGFENSSMDGYAVAFNPDDVDKSQIELPVIGESKAGFPFIGELKQGEAVLISTGAVVPKGTDRIIKVEDTEQKTGRVIIKDIGNKGDFIRSIGEEIKKGDVVANANDFLSPSLIAYLASFGFISVPVYAPPRVAILTTGEELVDTDKTPELGQIRNSNDVFLNAFLLALGIKEVVRNKIGDSLEKTQLAISDAESKTDIILICGGVSVGPHDHVKEAAESLGFERLFWRIKQKPGKPLYFAAKGKKLLFGIPGNPVSTVICSAFYIYPVLRHYLGFKSTGLSTIIGYFQGEKEFKEFKRTKLLQVNIVRWENNTAVIEAVELQKSHMLSSAASSDGFVIISTDHQKINPSDEFKIHLFPWIELDVEGY
ncbi:MAG: molybdopterin molybdotransferase MoeA [candidate division Zixibacteria bacterium]|nr:molybdopterin molybdotransferase MoeA [candidate division Zixibacteria bacterium]